jgi:hypothetical protein
MPAAPGPRPDQIQQPVGTNPGDVITATASGSPVFASPAGTGATGPTGPPGTGGGSITGLISHHIPIATATLGVTPPDLGMAGDIPTSVYVEGEERGEKLEFVIPEDYVSGNVELLATYRVSVNDTGGVGIVALEADVSIADTLSGMVITSTGPQSIDFNPVDTTDFERQAVLQILEGTFSPGDVVVIDLKRLGDQPTGVDTHNGDWEVAAFMYRYLGQVATRATTQAAEFFLATDEPTPPNGTLDAIPTSDYPSGSDTEQKATFIVPDNWDGLSDAEFKLTYAMGTAEDATVRIETEGNIADVESGILSALSPAIFDVLPEADTGPRRTVTIRSISRTALTVGSVITLKVARRTGFTENHGGDFKLINIVMTTGQASGVIEGGGSESVANTSAYGMAYRLSSYNFNAADTWETIDLDGGNNLLNNIIHSPVINPSRVIVDVAGDYEITYHAKITKDNNINVVAVSRLLQNGTTEVLGSYDQWRHSPPSISGVNQTKSIRRTAIVSLGVGDYVELQLGTNNTNARVNDSTAGPDPDTRILASIEVRRLIQSGGGGEQRQYSLFRDEKPQGTDGGSNNNGMWDTRDLNTKIVDVGDNVTLSANQFTLEPGVYEIDARAPANQMNQHRIRLRNITDGVTVIGGQNSAISNALGGPITHAFLRGRFIITTSKTFDFGRNMNVAGANEVYTEVQLYKVENLGGAGSTTYGHLSTGTFDGISGTVSGDTDAPTLNGDFQAWDTLTSSTPAGEIHVSYEGRIDPEQTQISSIDVPIKGTGDYALKVYVDGAITSNPVYDSGIQVAPASRTVLTVTDLDLPEQPTGEGRYFVVIEAFVDAGENVRVGLPFVRQD